MRFIPWIAIIWIVNVALAQYSAAAESQIPATGTAAVDQLIPWLLDENQQLHGVPFSKVIFDTTGKRVLPFDAKNAVDQGVAEAISAACHETMKRLNAPNSAIQHVDRINELSTHFEDSLPELLNAAPGLRCDFPLTAEGKLQRSGYPDLRIADVKSKRVFYLDPKLLCCRKPRQRFPRVLFRASGGNCRFKREMSSIGALSS
jgi:hypothetical protein